MRKTLYVLTILISSLLFSCKKETVEPTQPSKSVVTDTTTTNPIDSTNGTTEDSVGYLVFVIDLGLIDMTQPFNFTVFSDYDHSTSTGTLLPIDTSDLVIENSQGTFIVEVTYSEDYQNCEQFSLRLDEATYTSSTTNDVDIYFKLHKDGVPNNINFVYYNNMGVGGFTTSECYE